MKFKGVVVEHKLYLHAVLKHIITKFGSASSHTLQHLSVHTNTKTDIGLSTKPK